MEKADIEPIPNSPPLPPGEGWGEGKRTSESIEQTHSDSSHPHPRPPPAEKARGECGIGSYPIISGKPIRCITRAGLILAASALSFYY